MVHSSALKQTRFSVTAVFFANGVALGAWGTCIPGIAKSLNLDPGSYGKVVAPYAVGAILSMLLTGWLTTRIGTRRTMLLGTLLVAGTLVIPARASSIPLLALSIFFLGAANSVMDVSMNAHAALIERDWESEIMSTFHSLASFGALAGATLSGVLYARGYDAKVIMVAATGFIGVAVLAVYARIDDLRADPPEKSVRVRVWTNPTLLVISGLTFLALFSEFGMYEWSYKYVRDVTGASPSFATLGFSAYVLGAALSRLFGDAVMRRIGTRAMVLGGGLLACGGLLTAILFPTTVPAIIGFVCAGLGLANMIPMLYTRAAATVDGAPGVGVGVCGVISYAGPIVEPLMIGYVALHYGQRVGLRLPMAAIFVIAVCAPIISRMRTLQHHTSAMDSVIPDPLVLAPASLEVSPTGGALGT
ncbi:MAG: MFS transporter [Candidatus Acidiferrales bacterium]